VAAVVHPKVLDRVRNDLHAAFERAVSTTRAIVEGKDPSSELEWRNVPARVVVAQQLTRDFAAMERARIGLAENTTRVVAVVAVVSNSEWERKGRALDHDALEVKAIESQSAVEVEGASKKEVNAQPRIKVVPRQK
jgi:hypothetical protein